MKTNNKKSGFKFVEKFDGFGVLGKAFFRTEVVFKNKICSLYTVDDVKVAEAVLKEDDKFKYCANRFVSVVNDLEEANNFLNKYAKDVLKLFIFSWRTNNMNVENSLKVMKTLQDTTKNVNGKLLSSVLCLKDLDNNNVHLQRVNNKVQMTDYGNQDVTMLEPQETMKMLKFLELDN
jgi:hypothetical protein